MIASSVLSDIPQNGGRGARVAGLRGVGAYLHRLIKGPRARADYFPAIVDSSFPKDEVSTERGQLQLEPLAELGEQGRGGPAE